MLSDQVIRSEASSDTVYKRGCNYYRQGRVIRLDEVTDNLPTYIGSVDGTEPYAVRVSLTKDKTGIQSYRCTCPAAETYAGACKHVIAVLKEIQARLQEEEWDEDRDDPEDLAEAYNRELREAIAQLFGQMSRREPSARMVQKNAEHRLFSLFNPKGAGAVKTGPQSVYLVPRLFVEDGIHRVNKWLEFRIGIERLYVVRNLQQLLQTVKTGGDWALGTKGMLHTANMTFADETSEALWQMLEKAYADEKSLVEARSGYGVYAFATSYHFDQKAFRLTPSDFERFLQIMGDAPIEMHLDGAGVGDVRVAHRNPPVETELRKYKDGGRFSLKSEPLLALDEKGQYLYRDGTIFAVDADFARRTKPLLDAFAETAHIDIEAKNVGRFFSEVLPEAENASDVHVSSSFDKDYMIAPFSAELYIDFYKDGIAVKPVFCYDEVKFNPIRERPDAFQGRILIRNKVAEQRLTNLFDTYGFRKQRDQYVQPDEELTYEFLTDGVESLPDSVEVFYADTILSRPVRPMPKVTAGVSINDSDLLEVTFDTKHLDIEELMDILDAYRQKRRYHRLKDGTFLTLGDQQLSALADFADSAGLARGKVVDGKIEMPLSNAMYIDELAREDESLRLVRSKRFKSLVRDVRSPQDVDAEVPESLQPILRDYQVTGFNWLTSLAAHGLGGILADDMGLGKTLQVLAFLLSKQEAGAPPTLVVAPTSLVYNWQDEAQHFTPALQTVVAAGTKANRRKAIAAAFDENADILITTYNMLKKDIDLYENRTFRYVFLDEAQHIKNPATQNARAVKKLRAGGWFALTGTPIENTLTELWSIFDFMMPGYLGNHTQFKSHYETPIVRDQDERAGKDLRRHIRPFILRRMKKDVLTELPDKVERRIVSEMTPKQEKIYQAYFLRSQKDFAKTLQEHGFGESRIKILAILTRLRQIACDPSLFLESWDGGSGKLDQLEEVVRDAMEGGHRMLIFSQFTQMLARIAERLKGMKVPYDYLDGSTPAMERIRLVRQFNAGDTPVFLISLKAGGTGLTLTGADMVIHFDPWWNPAVEDQATDRAYRIGQKNKVQVYKMIARHTVEEKIYELQEKKKGLIDQMIAPGENFLSKLTEDEIRDLFR